MQIDYTLVKFEDITLKTRDGVKLRGYFASKYENERIMHNHDGDKVIFEYPKVQYKVINNRPMVCGIGEGAELISKVAFNTDEIIIQDRNLDSYQKEILKRKIEFGVKDDYLEYKFLTPWMALNQRNIEIYRKANRMNREEILKKILIGNILSMAKGLSYTVNEKLNIWIDFKECEVNFKNIKMIGFKGNFKVNFKIPNYLGLGKSVSRGFGTINLIENID